MSASKIIALFGATACGKTDLSIALAKALDGEIVNMDSMQVYKELHLGTAKPSPEEMTQVPHHLFSIVGVDEPFTVADYKKIALEKIEEIRARNKTVLLVGGTGLYLSALYYAFHFREPDRGEIHQASNQSLDGLKDLIDVQNPRRLQRALSTGIVHRTQDRVKSDLPIEIFWLDLPRATLHERIERRVERMMQQGLLAEARSLFDHESAYERSSARKGIGYKELNDYFCGKIGLNEAIEQIKIHTRQYAKRQITWIRNQYPTVHHLDGRQPISVLVKEIQLKIGGDSEKHS